MPLLRQGMKIAAAAEGIVSESACHIAGRPRTRCRIRNVYLARAVSVGHRMWAPWLKDGNSVASWTDKATQPFMMALALFGVDMAHRGAPPGWQFGA